MKAMGSYVQLKTGTLIYIYDDEIFRTEKEFHNAILKKGFSEEMAFQIIEKVKARVPYTSDEFEKILMLSGRSSQSVKRLLNGVNRKKK